MAYIGRGLDKLSNVDVLDAISFTDSAGPYNILKGGVAFIPSAIQNLLIEVDGVIQASDSYTITGSTITFGASMASSSTMNSFLHFGMGVTMTPADGTVTSARIADDAVITSKILDLNVTNAKLAGSITDAKITGLSSSKLTGALPAISGAALTALNATNIGSGTLSNDRLASPAVVIKGDTTDAGKLTLNCEQNTHAVSIQSPLHASAASYTLTLPVNDGDADQLLTTNGSGVLSWTTPAAGGAWTLLNSTDVSVAAAYFDTTAVFSSTYKLYKLFVFDAATTAAGTGTRTYFKFLVGTTVQTGDFVEIYNSVYSSGASPSSASVNTGGRTADNTELFDSWGQDWDERRNTSEMTLFNPNDNTYSNIISSQWTATEEGSPYHVSGNTGAFYKPLIAATGFRIGASADTVDVGTKWRLYGLADS